MRYQSVTIKKLFSATCEEVFDAWLDPVGMREWMRPGPVTNCDVIIDPHVGGTFRIVMSGPSGEFLNTGVFRILDRPSKLQFTWISSRWENQETLVTLEISPRTFGCELLLTHERFPLEYSSEQLVTGWNQILKKLFSQLEHSGKS